MSYKEMLFKAIDQLVGDVTNGYNEQEAKNRLQQEIRTEEHRISYSNYKKYESMKDKFQNFYNKCNGLSFVEIVDIAKDLLNCLLDE